MSDKSVTTRAWGIIDKETGQLIPEGFPTRKDADHYCGDTGKPVRVEIWRIKCKKNQ